MANLVRVTVPAPDDILAEYGEGAVILLARSETQDGSFADFGDPEPIAASEFSYEIADPDAGPGMWYQARYASEDLSRQSDPTDPFTPSQPRALATLDDYLLITKQRITDSKTLADIERKLEDATNDLHDEIGYSFFRQPRTGTEVRYFNGRGGRLLHVHAGIAALELVEIQPSRGSDFIALSGDDWHLEAEPGDLDPLPGDPWFHIALHDDGAYTTWPIGSRMIRLTLATGWPAVKSSHRNADVAWARQRRGLEGSLPGGSIGPDDMGQPVGPDLWPRAVYDLVKAETRRHTACTL